MVNDNDKPTLNPEADLSEAATPDSSDVTIPGPTDASVPENDSTPTIIGGSSPLIAKPDPGQYKSPAILPSSQAAEVLPGTAFNEKLKLDDKTLRELGVQSEDDLADDIVLERSPHDGACVVVAVKNGMPVCQYCFLPFVVGIPQYESAEIQVAKPDGSEQGVRVKVHASCHLKRMEELSKRH